MTSGKDWKRGMKSVVVEMNEFLNSTEYTFEEKERVFGMKFDEFREFVEYNSINQKWLKSLEGDGYQKFVDTLRHYYMKWKKELKKQDKNSFMSIVKNQFTAPKLGFALGRLLSRMR